MLKYIIVLVSSTILCSCASTYSAETDKSATSYKSSAKTVQSYVDLHDIKSLDVIFGKSADDLRNTISRDQFLVHVKSVEYTLSNTRPGTGVQWTGPDGKLLGDLQFLSQIEVPGFTVCNNFNQGIAYNGKIFEGKAMACMKDGKWVVLPSK